jgi:peptidoglycan/xylan/chitin deacetylase (PgdA/CDA1 family)
MYHYIRDIKHSRYPEIRGLEVSAFRQQIEFMKNNFRIVTMEQVIDAITTKSELPEKALLLTFDDGYIDNYTFAMPVLEEFGVQGSFFIPGKTFSTHQLLDVNKIHYILASADSNCLTEDLISQMDYYRGKEYEYPSTVELINVHAQANRFDSKETIFVKRMLQTVLPEKLRITISSNLFEKYVGISEEKLAYELYMSEDQIRTMKRHGMFIGLHGYDHYWLGTLPLNQMKNDITKALEALDEFIDRRCWVMNYPYGNYSSEVACYVKSKGACIGLTTKVRVADIFADSVLELPRLDCNDFPPKSDNYIDK